MRNQVTLFCANNGKQQIIPGKYIASGRILLIFPVSIATEHPDIHFIQGKLANFQQIFTCALLVSQEMPRCYSNTLHRFCSMLAVTDATNINLGS